MNAARIRQAAWIMKRARLALTPGMDRVAVALNQEPTEAELQEATNWSRAFALAAEPTGDVEDGYIRFNPSEG